MDLGNRRQSICKRLVHDAWHCITLVVQSLACLLGLQYTTTDQLVLVYKFNSATLSQQRTRHSQDKLACYMARHSPMCPVLAVHAVITDHDV